MHSIQQRKNGEVTYETLTEYFQITSQGDSAYSRARCMRALGILGLPRQRGSTTERLQAVTKQFKTYCSKRDPIPRPAPLKFTAPQPPNGQTFDDDCTALGMTEHKQEMRNVFFSFLGASGALMLNLAN